MAKQDKGKKGLGDRWIPTNERMPPEHERVMVFSKAKVFWEWPPEHRFRYAFGFCFWQDDPRIGAWWEGSFRAFVKDHEITHWQPLPAAPMEFARDDRPIEEG